METIIKTWMDADTCILQSGRPAKQLPSQQLQQKVGKKGRKLKNDPNQPTNPKHKYHQKSKEKEQQAAGELAPHKQMAPLFVTSQPSVPSNGGTNEGGNSLPPTGELEISIEDVECVDEVAADGGGVKEGETEGMREGEMTEGGGEEEKGDEETPSGVAVEEAADKSLLSDKEDARVELGATGGVAISDVEVETTAANVKTDAVSHEVNHREVCSINICSSLSPSSPYPARLQESDEEEKIAILADENIAQLEDKEKV